MPYHQLILLAPCHGLEDFPLYHTGDDAASLLACWTALWHPLFLREASQLPHVERCDYPPENLRDALLLLPLPCEAEMDVDLPENAAQQGATLLRGLHCRQAILQRALQPFGELAQQIDAELCKDFLAFGFAFLQVELLTQQMRYASCIDQTRIARTIKEAAEAAIIHDVDRCRDKLTSCHDALADERSHYYPVDVYFLDLTLLAAVDSTLGASLEEQLQRDSPQNILASGETVERLASKNPRALELLKDGLQQHRIGLAGGEFQELPLPLMTLESGLRQLQRGRVAYHQHLGTSPATYGRRRSGIYPSWLHGLRAAKFTSALHFKFDEGLYPEGGQCKTKWQAEDGQSLETYARKPLDAASHDTFLNLPSQLSDTMDTDHVAARMFVHWPGSEVPWYDDLLRCHRYGSALGRFVTLAEFFAETGDTGSSDRFQSDDYRYPILKQMVAGGQANPLSSFCSYWRRSLQWSSTQGLELLAGLLGQPAAGDPSSVEAAVDDLSGAPGTAELLAERHRQALAAFATGLDVKPAPAVTVVNPLSFPRRILIRVPATTPAGGENVYAAEVGDDGHCRALVDVPAMGFTSVHFQAGSPPLAGPEIAESLTLKNEFLQATIDEHTGALRSLRDYQSRTTRVSQQVGLRITLPKTGQPWVDRQAPVAYSVMAADSVEITQNGRIQAEITSRGRMLALNGEPVGQFQQRYRVVRGSRIVVIEVEITPAEDLLLDDPWDSYYACRFAFGDESAVLRAGARMQVHDTSKRRIEAPLLVDIDAGNHRTTILTGGLPFHRRAAEAQLDTLLAVPGETAPSYRLGIGLDLPSSVRSALDFLAQDVASSIPGAAPASSGWLLHLDARHVVISSCRSLANGSRIHLRLVESEGRAATVRLSGCRPIVAASYSNLEHEELEPLEVEEGVARIPIKAYQVAELLLQL